MLLLLAGAVLLRTADTNTVRGLRNLAFDTLNRAWPRPVTHTVVIVDIDEASLARPELGQWPWSRLVLANLVRTLESMGAKTIAFDMVFAEADRTSPRAFLDRLPPAGRDPALAPLLTALPDNDALFTESIRASGKVVTAFIWTDKALEGQRRPHLSKPIQISKGATALRDHVPEMASAAVNLAEIERAAAGNGCFGVLPEIDGIIRQVPLLFRMNSPGGKQADLYPSLALEALRVAQDPRTIVKVRDLKPGEAGLFDPPLKMQIGKLEIPLDINGQFPVWFSPQRRADYIPAHAVLSGAVDPAKIRDKIVFVGTSAQGLKDLRSTPLDLFVPGVELHANVAEQALSGRFLYRPRLVDGAELLFLGVAGLLLIGLAPFLGAVAMGAVTALTIATAAGVSWLAFVKGGILIDPVYPGLCFAVFYGVASALSYMRSEAGTRQVRQAFGLYISPHFMEELTRDPDKLRLGGQTRELTVMFTDIRNFTSLSERLTPEELIALMNDFLTPMADLVMENRGTIDKFMGDAMMAFWNAPLQDPDHARHACLSALRMQAALEPVNAALARRADAEGSPPIVLQAGIGINTGPASVGNMGSRRRFAYSALGDTVNLASRLEGQTKTYGLTNLIGPATRAAVPDFAVLEIDLIRVKGKTRPVQVFTLVGDTALAQTPAFRTWAQAHETLITAWRARDLSGARAALADSEKSCETAGFLPAFQAFYALYADRLADLAANDPGPDWDGVFVAKTK